MSGKDIALLCVVAIIIFIIGLVKGASIEQAVYKNDIENTGHIIVDKKLYYVYEIKKDNK